jgi:hypothetical protein
MCFGIIGKIFLDSLAFSLGTVVAKVLIVAEVAENLIHLLMKIMITYTYFIEICN